MQPLATQPGLTQQVYQTLLDAICDGSLAPGAHLVQEQLAAKLGVSRQPIQQALAILKTEGLLLELGKRGLFVAPIDLAFMRHHYEIRSALDGLAARRTAARAGSDKALRAVVQREGRAAIAAGRAAVKSGDIAEMVRCDVAFHSLIYLHSGNPLLTASAEAHWRQLRRIMGEVLRRAAPPAEIWRQHDEILAALVSADASRAEALAITHVAKAQEGLEAALGTNMRDVSNPGGS